MVQGFVVCLQSHVGQRQIIERRNVFGIALHTLGEVPFRSGEISRAKASSRPRRKSASIPSGFSLLASCILFACPVV